MDRSYILSRCFLKFPFIYIYIYIYINRERPIALRVFKKGYNILDSECMLLND